LHPVVTRRPDFTEALWAVEEALFQGERERAEKRRGDLEKKGAPPGLLAEVDAEILATFDGLPAAIRALQRALENTPEDRWLLLRLADFHLDARDPIPALSLLRPLATRRALKRDLRGELPRDALGQTAALCSEVFLVLGELKKARKQAEEGLKVLGEDPALWAALASAHYENLDFADALQAIGHAIQNAPQWARAENIRAWILTALGRHDEADEAFSKAHALDPVAYFRPVRMDEDAFAEVVEAGLAALPPRLADALVNISVAVEDIPSKARLTLSDPPLSAGILGLFEGTPPMYASTEDPFAHFPRHITLFRKNLEASCASPDELLEQIRITLLHELGHYFGYDEDDLEARGLD
jgi:predicted Zn-dependent protease with MMP-like domain